MDDTAQALSVTSEPSAPPDPTYRALTWLLPVAAGAVIFGVILRISPVLCPNDASRWSTIWSLVEKHTYVIDGTPWDTIDKVHRDGHDYSSKIPLLPTMLAGEYWLIKHLTHWSIKDKTNEVCRTIIFTVNVLPLIIYLVLIGGLIGRHVSSPWWRVYWLVAAAFGTYVTSYSVTLNDHSLSGWSALFALYSGVRILYEGDRRPLHFALAGLFTAFLACNQLPAVFFAVGLFGWLLVREPKRTLLFFVPAAALPVIGFLVTTHISTGGFIPYYLMKHTVLYNYPGGYWSHPKGIDALNEPKHWYVFNFLLGHHGFFTLSPIFILSVVSFVHLLRERAAPLRGFVWFALIVSLLTMALNTAQTNNYGGGCQGFRYLIWPVPLWIMVGAIGADRYGLPRWVKVLAVLFLFVSVVSMACATGNPWTESWLADLWKQWGWRNY
jgi:hypothetical protein